MVDEVPSSGPLLLPETAVGSEGIDDVFVRGAVSETDGVPERDADR